MKNKDDFFSKIEDTLHTYEDAYVPGAWEAFDQKRKRRRLGVVFFRVGSAAAILLLFLYAGVRFFMKDEAPVQVAQTKVKTHQPKTETVKTIKPAPIVDKAVAGNKTTNTPKVNEAMAAKLFEKVVSPQNTFTTYRDSAALAITSKNKAQVITTTITKPDQQKIIAVQQPATIRRDSTIVNTNNVPAIATNITRPEQKVTTVEGSTVAPVTKAPTDIIAQTQTPPKKLTPAKKSMYESLVNETKNSPANGAKKSLRNLTYAVVVSPSMGNQKVNFGTGVEVSYNISDKLSITSGVAYSSLNASTTTGSSAAVMASGVTSVQGVDLQVSGLEVPVGLQYRTGGGFYINAGVLGMSVMNKSLQYNYTAETTYSATALSSSGNEINLLRVANEKKTEESKERIQNVLGFYMLSVGKKKAIGRHNQLNFGPFLRIPFGAVSSENIRLMQGGVRLGVEF